MSEQVVFTITVLLLALRKKKIMLLTSFGRIKTTNSTYGVVINFDQTVYQITLMYHIRWCTCGWID